ncbi:MAG: amino acid deaminase [Rubrivivax sp.]|nr:amino acid deaminase [Rubrivivax sp.]
MQAPAPDDTDPLLGPWLKGYPPAAEPVRRSALARQGWRLTDAALPFPLAVLRQSALAHNLAWLQTFAAERGLDLAPHGKTTMSPGLFRRQLDAGAWGITFATVFQLAVGVAAGVRRALIANQVQQPADLAGLARLLARHEGLRVAFLVDSVEQLRQVEAWRATQRQAPQFEVLLELGIPGGRTGVRAHDGAVALGRALHASPAVRLVGVECYEGLGVTGDDATDRANVQALGERLQALARALDAEGLFECDEVIVSAGGSSLFDLIAPHLKPALGRPVRGILRSGCYVTHDHGHYQRLVDAVVRRCGCSTGLQGALEVWTTVQSRPEPGLALLTGGRRDMGNDAAMPRPLALVRAGAWQALADDGAWTIKGLNDQHAHLRFAADTELQPRVGDTVVLGVSHPCTTFDKWHWMPVVDDEHRVVDAVTMHF